VLALLAAFAAACALAPLGASLGALACRVARAAGRAGRAGLPRAAASPIAMPSAGSPYRHVERAGDEALPPWIARVLERQARRRANFCVSAAHTTPGA
jgi:hypothetical protein